MDTNSIRQIVHYVWQIVTPGLVIYVGFLLYRQIQALKGTVEAQKATIEAQGAVLQTTSALTRP